MEKVLPLRSLKAPQILTIGLILGAAGCTQAPLGNSMAPSTARISEKAEPPIEIRVIKLNPLLDEIKAQQGKIVVLDTWATWCLPCKEEFPELVKLHERHTNDGVVCMSVSIDKPDEREAALGFLKKHRAAFANYLIDEDDEVWGNKWDIKSIPVVLVFGRDGKLARKFDKDDPDHQFTYKDVEKFVNDMVVKVQ